MLESITVFIPTLPNHGSIYANSINGIIANPFQTYTEQCPNGTAGYFSLNYLALRILQPIPKIEIMKFQDFIWPTKQINKTLVKLALIGKKIRFIVSKLVVGYSEVSSWLNFFPPTNYAFALLYPYEKNILFLKDVWCPFCVFWTAFIKAG